jgi:hypothetical protein
MRAAIDLQDAVVEVFDSQAEARHAHAPDGLELRLAERSRLAFESNLLGCCPGGCGAQARDEALQLTGREERRCAAAKINEVQRAPGDGRRLEIQLPLPGQHVEILLDLARALVDVDAEVTEVAPLAAERDVEIQAERDGFRRGAAERIPRLGRGRLGGPDRERRVIRNEITTDRGLFDIRRGRCSGHVCTYTKEANR